ncbi:hypothetical protein SSP35_23_00120 [Streptomyces sp. NBRC 110611]|uniref:hypothetical protein n=1 Tax=Streptomyces sp. NBRC 110611 TaxID=1621259 RepID=UPI00083119EC|nr:hypothetical protein [Streptomyces sp. NBRC 110611]GAU70822.1 hypothetical protein SSP35_23_00120 [Streptomyces sp. NBRC 110611]
MPIDVFAALGALVRAEAARTRRTPGPRQATEHPDGSAARPPADPEPSPSTSPSAERPADEPAAPAPSHPSPPSLPSPPSARRGLLARLLRKPTARARRGRK